MSQFIALLTVFDSFADDWHTEAAVLKRITVNGGAPRLIHKTLVAIRAVQQLVNSIGAVVGNQVHCFAGFMAYVTAMIVVPKRDVITGMTQCPSTWRRRCQKLQSLRLP